MASDSAGLNYAGIDTHKDIHVVAVINSLGRLLATAAFLTTLNGYHELYDWLVDNGPLGVVGIEGTGSYRAGIAALLAGHDLECRGGQPARSSTASTARQDRPGRR